MAAGERHRLPPRFLPGSFEERLADARAPAGRVDIDISADLLPLVFQANRLLEGPERMVDAAAIDPRPVFGIDGERLGRSRRHPKAHGARSGALLETGRRFGGQEIEDGLSVVRHQGVEIDQRAKPFGRLVGHTGDHHAAIAVAAQDDVGQFLTAKNAKSILDMRIEVGCLVKKVRPFSKAGQRRREHVMTGLAQARCDPRPAPAPLPGAVNQNECCHDFPRYPGPAGPDRLHQHGRIVPSSRMVEQAAAGARPCINP